MLLLGAGASNAVASTATTMLYRPNGASIGTASSTFVNGNTQLTVTLQGARPLTSYVVQECITDPLGSGGLDCPLNSTFGYVTGFGFPFFNTSPFVSTTTTATTFTVTTDQSGNGTVTATVPLIPQVSVILVSNLGNPGDSAQGTLISNIP